MLTCPDEHSCRPEPLPPSLATSFRRGAEHFAPIDAVKKKRGNDMATANDPFFAREALDAAELQAALARLDDRTFARGCVDRAVRDCARGRVKAWLPALALVAARRLKRVAEMEAHYARFLAGLDGTRRPDWHADVSNPDAASTLLQQSGRIAQSEAAFSEECARVVEALGDPAAGAVLDIGCGGGMWTLLLARMGYRAIGTDHHANLVAAATSNAAQAGVSDRASFLVDDACDSRIADGFCSRAICIGVTPTLPDEPAFDALVGHLDRVTRPPGDGPRLVVLGSNRWQPSREAVVRAAVERAVADPADALRRLRLVELSWWLAPRHLEKLQARFRQVDVLGVSNREDDGIRIDLLLR